MAPPPADEPSSQTPRPRVSSSTSIVNFAPQPLGARRPSWIAPSPSTMSLPDAAGRRPSWTPALEGSGHGHILSMKSKQRMFYPPPEEESSGVSSSSDSSPSSSRPAAEGDSSEDTSNFRMGMQIDMKALVGDAVGNVCAFFYAVVGI